jgi:GNAT superfamily N-acetyltransferase
MKTYSQFIVESQEVLNKISSAYERKHPGMKLNVSHSPKTKSIQLNLIRVPKEKRNQGIGSRAIKGISNYAKKQNLSVSLTPEPEKGKKGKLQQFYKKRGFKRNKDLAISDTHILNP